MRIRFKPAFKLIDQLVLGAKNFELQNPSFKTNLNDRPTYGDIFTNVSSVVEF